jgi:preprotein translocase subunit SecF
MSKKRWIGSNRILLVVPIAMLVISSGFLISNFMSTGEWFERSIELKGGTLISVRTDTLHDTAAIEESLSQQFGRVIVRGLRSFSGSGFTVQVDANEDSGDVVQALETLGVDTREVSIQTTGPSLGETFWMQAQVGIIMAFIIMGIIVFAIFRTFVSSTAVIAAAVANLIVTLGIMQVLSFELSLPSFAALLMLIGYSIDTDILLTTRVIRNTDNPLKERFSGAFKTGMTMTLTTLSVLAAVVLTTTSPVIFAIASVMLIGLSVDILNTWILNANIIGWYAVKRGLE